jgi:nitrogen fixation NifU-like protein
MIFYYFRGIVRMGKDRDLEKYARQLQEQILEQIKSSYTEKTIDHWQNPRNFEKMDNTDGYARMTGSCGDTMEMFLKLRQGKVEKCTFQTDGCGTTIACGSTATELAQNKSFTEALARVSADEILKHLGGLPEESVHCAQLAAETLRRALADYLYQKKTPWKKTYRKT